MVGSVLTWQHARTFYSRCYGNHPSNPNIKLPHASSTRTFINFKSIIFLILSATLYIFVNLQLPTLLPFKLLAQSPCSIWQPHKSLMNYAKEYLSPPTIMKLLTPFSSPLQPKSFSRIAKTLLSFMILYTKVCFLLLSRVSLTDKLRHFHRKYQLLTQISTHLLFHSLQSLLPILLTPLKKS